MLPLFVIGAAVLVQLGVILGLQLRLEHAAREGARAAAVAPDEADARARQAIARAGLDDTRIAVQVDAEFVEVEVSTDINPVPLLSLGARTLRASVAMRREDLLS